MSLSVTELSLAVAELQALVGGAVQKAYVPRARTALLELRQPGHTRWLFLSAEPGHTRIHLARARPPAPTEPLPFQGLLRAHLVGRRLAGLEQRAGDRVVIFRFEDREGARTFVAELTGRHGNLFLLSEAGAILGLGGPNLSQRRALAPGTPYVPPASETPAPAQPPRFSPGPPFAVSEQIEAFYAGRDTEATHRALRARLERPLRRRIERLERTLAKVKQEAERGGEAERHRIAGELLKVHLHQIERGATEVALTDFSRGEPAEVMVRLRPDLSPRENVDWHFRQYRRLSGGAARAAARFRELESQQQALAGELAALAGLGDEELAQRATAATVPPAPRKARVEQVRRPYRELIGAGGRRIWVGKGAAENERLSFKLARGHDLWLHARGRAGAHVVVPLDRGEQVTQALLLDAAALAVHFSEAKGEPRAEVSYLPARYLRKPKGSKPGQVVYSQEKTLVYVHEPERIARLLASREGD